MIDFLRRARWILSAVLLLQAPTAYAHDWLLALTWHPAFCAQRPQSVECEDATARLVLHGLWPQGPPDAEFCGSAPTVRALDRQRKWCALPPVPLSEEAVKATDAVMPGRRACLDRHEWHRHGTCSGLSPDAYFMRSSSLAARVDNLTINTLLAARAGSTITSGELAQAIEKDFGPAGRRAFAMICAKRHDAFHLTEVRILLNEDSFHLFPSAQALSKKSPRGGRRCPDHATLIVAGRE